MQAKLTNLTSRVFPIRAFRFFDIASNLSDDSFSGIHHGKECHPSDLPIVISRAKSIGVEHFLLAGGNLEESQKAYSTSLIDSTMYCTVGIHPCRSSSYNSEEYFNQLYELILTAGDKVKAVGECGLDYDRLNYADRDTQIKAFTPHFELAERTGLPMYFHNRNTQGEFLEILRRNRDRFSRGVVHSFTGDSDELRNLLDMDLFIGINGCSLKTQENCEVAATVPLDRILLETDCPYCEIRKTHFSYKYVKTHFDAKRKERHDVNCMVRGRNEPCTIIQVLQALAGIMQTSEEELANAAFENSLRCFNIS